MTGGVPGAATGGVPAVATGGVPAATTGGVPAAATGGVPAAATGGTPAVGTGGMGTGGIAMGTGGMGTGGMGTGGGAAVSADCMKYCTCMKASCATSAFPTGQTCEQHCAAASAAALTCWNMHCGFVATLGASHCAHALGDGTVCMKM